jgi:hypothetical protein
MKAKRAGDLDAVAMLGKEIDANQASCLHPTEHKRTMTLRRDGLRNFKCGDRVRWCMVCNKILGYE